MDRQRKHANGDQPRHPDRLCTIMVPCGFSGGRGRHPLNIVLAEDGTLLHVSSQCSHGDDREAAEAAERMNHDTCLGWLYDFLKAARDTGWRDPSLSKRLEKEPVLVTLMEHARRAAKDNIDSKGRKERGYDEPPALSTLTRDAQNVRVAQALSRWLNDRMADSFTLGIRNRIGWRDENVFRVQARNLDKHDPESGDVLFDKAGRPERIHQLIFQIYGMDGWHSFGQVVRGRTSNGAFCYRLEIDAKQARESAASALISERGECLACAHDYEGGGKRHARSPKHRSKVAAIVRRVRRVFEEREGRSVQARARAERAGAGRG
jgi:hypothetical protein